MVTFRDILVTVTQIGSKRTRRRSDHSSQMLSDPTSGTRCARLRARLRGGPGKDQREDQCRWSFPGPAAGVERPRAGQVPDVERVSRAAQGCRTASSCGLLLRPKWLRCPSLVAMPLLGELARTRPPPLCPSAHHSPSRARRAAQDCCGKARRCALLSSCSAKLLVHANVYLQRGRHLSEARRASACRASARRASLAFTCPCGAA